MKTYALRLSVIAFLTLFLIVFSPILRVSSIITGFSTLEIGKIAGPNNGSLIWGIFLLFIIAFPAGFLLNWGKGVLEKDFFKFIKPRKKKIGVYILVSILTFLLVTFSYSMVFMPKLYQKHSELESFTNEHKNDLLEQYTVELSDYLAIRLNNSYKQPESAFEIDGQICATLLDNLIMGLWNVTRSDIILYQGWGSCGQSAIVTQQILYDAGYETRLAHFKGIDHAWAEVQKNGTWLMVDPGYIGNLVKTESLRDLKTAFQSASGVEVQYFNGTVADASKEHGY